MLRTFLWVVGVSIVGVWAYHRKPENIQANYIANPGIIDKTSPPCLQMYYTIEKYAEEYGIPRDYAFGIANAETGYRGPFHWGYNQSLTSTAGAVGPMQIMPQYAAPYVDGKFTRAQLRDDIEMNVKASMRMLRKLKNKHGDWKLAFGAYNTGRPCVNGYAEKVSRFKPSF